MTKGKSPFLIGDTSWTCCFSIVIYVFWGSNISESRVVAGRNNLPGLNHTYTPWDEHLPLASAFLKGSDHLSTFKPSIFRCKLFVSGRVSLAIFMVHRYNLHHTLDPTNPKASALALVNSKTVLRLQLQYNVLEQVVCPLDIQRYIQRYFHCCWDLNQSTKNIH